jgi:hypothetical protein
MLIGWRAPILIIFVVVACRAEFHVIRPTILRLVSGDSVVFVATGPIFSPEGDTGMMYEYHPFISLDDTARLRLQALDLWKVVKPKAESLKAPFVVLRATTRFTEDRRVPQPDTIRNYGFVLERHIDGRWYLFKSVNPKTVEPVAN